MFILKNIGWWVSYVLSKLSYCLAMFSFLWGFLYIGIWRKHFLFFAYSSIEKNNIRPRPCYCRHLESFITIVLHVRCLRKISAVHLFFILSWNKNKNSPWHAAVNTALLDIDQTVPDSCKTEKKKSTFWRVHRGKDKTISYRQVIRKRGTAWGASCGPREGTAAELRDSLKFPASPPAFMFCLQTLLTLHHTVDISCAYGPVWRRVLTAPVTSDYKKIKIKMGEKKLSK